MTFNFVYEQLLKELFNTKQTAEWIFHDGEFHTILQGPNDIYYTLNITPFWELKLPGEAFNVKQMSPKQWKTLQHGTWHIEFGDDESSDEIGITGEQGTNSPKVFSLVGNAILNKAKEQPTIFKNFAFSAKEPSRQSLYRKLSEILARKLNKNVVVSDSGEWFYLIQK